MNWSVFLTKGAFRLAYLKVDFYFLPFRKPSLTHVINMAM